MRRIAGFAIVLLANASAVAAQQTPNNFAQAQGAMAQQNYARAIELLEPFVKANPQHGAAWNTLGTALRLSGRWKEAIPAHQSATAVARAKPAALYNIALAHAAGGQMDSAFFWFEEARRTGRIDLTAVGADPLAQVLSKDPRYKSLFPTAAEFAKPFAEPAKIIHEWRGAQPGDQFGWIARSIGDANGDKVEDAVMSATTSDSAAGRVYVYSGKSGALLWSAKGPQRGAQLGTGLEAAGDVNGDGGGDVVAGAPGMDRAFVYSGRDGRLLLTLASDTNGVRFGAAVASAGDVNNDRRADIIVGAPGHNAAGAGAGRVFVFSGADGKLLWQQDGERAGDSFGSAVDGDKRGDRNFIVVGASAGGPRTTGRVYVYDGLKEAFRMDSDSTGAAFGGMFVSVGGDVNADRTPDIYVMDFPNSAQGPSTGRAYVYSGKGGSRLHMFTGEAPGDGFGIGNADAGDVDRDGHADLVIGAWQHASRAASGGKIYLYSGKTGALIRAWTGTVPGETLGFDATGIGDVNGDGVPDMLLTSAWSAINGTRSGRVFIVSGAN